MRFLLPRFLLLLSGLLLLGCGDDTPTGDGVEPAYFDEDYGKSLMSELEAPGKEDSINGRTGLPVSVDSSDTAVWEVRNQWADTDTPEAREAGMAWEANSGLNWDEKYALWIESMVRIPGHNTFYETFELTTPFGKTVPAPSLECAETSIFLRVAFASWYGLPFYMEAGSGPGGRVFFGHFGARTAEGRYGRTPRYKTAYQDFSHMSADDIARDGWPSDAKLRTKRIGGTSADDQPFIGADAHAGAYFDEVFLNKRVGHFMTLFLSYFGSVNLADSNNTFNITPESIMAGDTLLERWQRRGIGHTLVIKHVVRNTDGSMEAELVSGSMPRRQPKWEDAPSSKRTFTLQNTGGEGENSDGAKYAALGGGIKRWRVAQLRNGRYRNVVLSEYRDIWIPNWDLNRISARPGQFDTLLGEVTPEQKREVLLRQIEDNRNHLRQYPASCSARIRREEAFAELYALNQTQGISVAETDSQHRLLEDYVFAELVYEDSKTCCWNSSTDKMFDIAMDLNEAHVYDAATQTCNAPIVFKASDGGYDVFKNHAESLGRGADWVAWSEDESCPQRGTVNDTEAAHTWAPFCEVHDALLGLVDTSACPDSVSGNHALESAPPLDSGTLSNMAVCAGEDDYFSVSLSAGESLSVSMTFTHSSGDLDLELLSAGGDVLTSSAGVSNSEQISYTASAAETVFVRVFGFAGASNTYALSR